MSDINPCYGSGAAPADKRIDKGECPECGRWYKLTSKDKVRQHPARVRPQGFTVADEDLELPPENQEQEPPTKTNSTPDLSDEEYMEQLYLIAQAIAVMPGQRDSMPNVTVPPPIRPRWAAFLLSLGMRLVPELATHRLKNPQSPAAGNWGPRERVELTNRARTSLKRGDLAEVWHQMNPESFEAVQSGRMSREDLINQLPQQMQQAARLADKMRTEEAEEHGRHTPQ